MVKVVLVLLATLQVQDDWRWWRNIEVPVVGVGGVGTRVLQWLRGGVSVGRMRSVFNCKQKLIQ